jgi:hypothetical protein
LFGVELVYGVVDGVPVGEVDASLGEGGGDLFGGGPRRFRCRRRRGRRAG